MKVIQLSEAKLNDWIIAGYPSMSLRQVTKVSRHHIITRCILLNPEGVARESKNTTRLSKKCVGFLVEQ